MVDFTPTINDTGVPNLLGASRGTGPNKTFEALFGGLAETFDNVTNIRDDATKANIEQDARQGFESVNSDFGFTPPDVPAGMQSELDRVQSLQSALKQGKISEVNYYGRLATLSKQLRAKYPRYEGIVDQTIQSVTGTRPANAYRDAIFSELNHIASEASDQDRFRRQYEKQFQGEIALLFGPDYFQNPEKYNFEDVQTKVSEFNSKAISIDTEVKQLQLLSKRGEVNDRQAERTLSRDFSFLVTSDLNAAIGGNRPSFNQMMADFAEGGLSGENLDQFVTNITSAESRLRASLQKRGTEMYVSKGIATQEQVNKAIDEAMYPITKAKEAIVGGDFKYAAAWATLNKAMTDEQLTEMLKKSPAVRAGAGLNELNQQFGEEFYRTHMNEIETVATEVAGQAVLGSSPSIIKDTIEQGNNKLSANVLKTTVEILKNPKLQGEKVSNLVDQIYGKNAIDLMDPRVVDKDDLETVFTTLLDPKIIQNIKQNGTPEDLETVTDWALEKFASIPAFRSAAGNLSDAMSQLQDAEISFDPKSNRLKIEVAKDWAARSGTPFQGMAVRDLSRFLGSFNKSMAVLGPLADALGEDKQKMVDRLLNNLSVEYETRNQGSGFFSMVRDKIAEAATAVAENAGDAPKASDMISLPDLSGVTDVVNRGREALGNALEGDGPSKVLNMPGMAGNRPSTPVPEPAPLDDTIELPQITVTPTEIDFVLSSPEAATDLATDPVYGVQVRQMANGDVTGPLNDFVNEKSAFAVASKFNGLSEGRDRTVLAQFIKKATGTSIDPAKTAWCAAFVNAALGATGREGTDSLAARSFLSYGEPTNEPTKGDIVVLSRGNSKWQGHVGFFVSQDDDTVTILGGNQGNKVSIKSFPKSKVLGFRRPPKIS